LKLEQLYPNFEPNTMVNLARIRKYEFLQSSIADAGTPVARCQLYISNLCIYWQQ